MPPTLRSMPVPPTRALFALPSAVPTLLAVYVTVHGFAPVDQLEQRKLFIKQNTACETPFSYPDHGKSNK